MPTVYKVLGQSKPSAATATTLYTVPASTSTVVSTITVCNQTSSDDTFRIAVRPAGASLADQHYIVFGDTVVGNSIYSLTLGITLATTDVLTVYTTNGSCSFNAYGSEIS
jgi:hypothetical protein